MQYALQTPMWMTGNANFLCVTTTTVNNVNRNGKVALNGNKLIGMQSFVTSVSVLVTIRLTVIYYRKPDLSYTNHLHNHNLTDHPAHPVGSTSPNTLIRGARRRGGRRAGVLV